MRHRSRHLYIAAVLEAPLWMLLLVLAIVTAAVIVTGLTAI